MVKVKAAPAATPNMAAINGSQDASDQCSSDQYRARRLAGRWFVEGQAGPLGGGLAFQVIPPALVGLLDTLLDALLDAFRFAGVAQFADGGRDEQYHTTSDFGADGESQRDAGRYAEYGGH